MSSVRYSLGMGRENGARCLVGRERKGQMEIIGLVIIVILITLGMLFMAIFALKADPDKKVFTRKGLAYSTMSALMKTTIIESDCVTGYSGSDRPQLGKDIVEDCAANFDEQPNGYSQYRCGGVHSCVFLEQKTKELLNMTLGSWRKNYEFHSELVQAVGSKPVLLLEVKGGFGCAKKDRDSSGLFPIQAGDAGLVENVLYLCD